jgi:AbiV family abortive infection protein
MKKETLQRYNTFRRNCLANAENALQAAQLLIGKGKNHLVYHLCVLVLEKIGKIFLGWLNLRDQDNGTTTSGQFDMEDHIRKLFWAIWGPSFLEECFDPQAWEDNRGLATELHTTRLSSIYTGIDDLTPSSDKVSEEQANNVYRLAITRLSIAQNEDVQDEDEPNLPDPVYERFLSLLRIPAQRDFIFGSTSHAKMKELGNWHQWIAWLVEHFSDEATRLDQLLQQEFARQPLPDQQTFSPKWRITFTLYTTTHTVRNAINAVQIDGSHVRIRAGKDDHSGTGHRSTGNHCAFVPSGPLCQSTLRRGAECGLQRAVLVGSSS